jgi:transcriptional regulator with XRE-family HTH domain
MEPLSPIAQRVARRLQSARLAAGLSRAELARRAHVSRPYIFMLEAGQREPSLVTVAALARALGVSIGALVD